MKKKARIGIFGGSFDPPHCAHLELLKKTKEQFSLEKIFVVPSKYPPGKTATAPFEKRLHWTKKVFESIPKVEVSDFEGNSSQTVFGKEIYAHLALKHPSAQHCWILGEDQFERLAFWRDIEGYASELEWLVWPRAKQRSDFGIRSKRLSVGSCAYRWTDCEPMLEVASHGIREAIAGAQSKKLASTNESLSWVPEEIRDEVIKTYQGELKT